jgi:hypothetical protein
LIALDVPEIEHEISRIGAIDDAQTHRAAGLDPNYRGIGEIAIVREVGVEIYVVDIGHPSHAAGCGALPAGLCRRCGLFHLHAAHRHLAH